MQFNKCDRCGRQVKDLTQVATTIPKEKSFQQMQQEEVDKATNFFPFTFSSPDNTVSIELCNDCLRVLIRWMVHPENFLMKTIENRKKFRTNKEIKTEKRK